MAGCVWRACAAIRRESGTTAGLQPSEPGKSFRAVGGLRAGDAVALLQEFYVTGNPRGARARSLCQAAQEGGHENNVLSSRLPAFFAAPVPHRPVTCTLPSRTGHESEPAGA